MDSYKNAGYGWYQIHAGNFSHAAVLNRKKVLWFAKKYLEFFFQTFFVLFILFCKYAFLNIFFHLVLIEKEQHVL